MCVAEVSVRQSVYLSRMHRMTPHGESDLRLCFTVRGHSVQPLPNYLGLLLLLSADCTASVRFSLLVYVYTVPQAFEMVILPKVVAIIAIIVALNRLLIARL